MTTAQCGGNENTIILVKLISGKENNKCINVDKISCLYLNARNIRNRRDELELPVYIYIIENKPSIIDITDSRANRDVGDGELNLER